MKITRYQHQIIVKEYTQKLTPIITLSKRYGVTRQAIYKILKSHGIDTSKRKLKVSCAYCGKELERHKMRIRKQKRHFCNDTHYYEWLKDGGPHSETASSYKSNKQGQRKARQIIEKLSKWFVLEDGNVIHHEDRNQENNNLKNLKVFASHSDHMKYHRLGTESVTPIFDGLLFLKEKKIV